MPMPEEEFTRCAIHLLHQFGLEVERVPTQANARTPDLRSVGGSETYAIELKQRDSDRVLHAITESGPRAIHQLVPFGLTRDAAIQSVVRDAAHQLRLELETTFRVVWVQCEGFDDESDQMQVQNSLLGSEYLIDRGSGGRSYLCHFFGESDFWRYRAELDAAIVSRQVDRDNINYSLLINPHSSRNGRLKASSLVASIGPNAVVDVEAEEAALECLIADCDLPRSDCDAVLEYVRAKYDLDLARLPVRRFGGVIRL